MKRCVTFFITTRTLSAFLIILSISAQSIHAQAAATAPNPRKVDYSEAVNQLLKLGFPNAKGAQYVNVKSNDLRYSYRDDMYESHTQDPDNPDLSGNGFYFPNSDSAKPGKLILSGGKILKLARSRSNYEPGLITGTFKKADLKKDLVTIKEWIVKTAAEDNWEWRGYGDRNCSIALGMANLAYHMGYKKEATDLMNTLFLTHDNPEGVINHLINNLATREYATAYTSFQKSNDWKHYLNALTALHKKFPRGWKQRPALDILMPLVRDRVANKPAPIPVIKGHTFSPAITKLIQLTTSNAGTENNSRFEPPFLINQPPKNTKSSGFNQLTQQGMDGFIAIVSLIGDPTLMIGSQNAYDRFSGGMDVFMMSHMHSDDALSIEALYTSLNKPSSRGAIAKVLIQAHLPHPREAFRRLNDAQLRDLAIAWWKAHRNDSPLELSKHYLAQGNKNHVTSIATSLLKQNTPESIKMLEDAILSSENPSSFNAIVKSYTIKRRSKAKDFILRYQKVLTKELGDGKNDDYNTTGQYEIAKKGGVNKYIAMLLRYTEDLKPSQLLAKLSKKKANTEEILEQLETALKGKDITKDVNKFIYAAAKATLPNKRSAILNTLFTLVNALPEIKNYKQPTFSKYEREDWLSLLKEDPDKQHNYGPSNSYILTMILEKFCHPNDSLVLKTYYSNIPADRLQPYLDQRNNDHLAGKKLAAIPDPDDVSEPQLAQLNKSLKTIPLLKLRETIAALPLHHQIALLSQVPPSGAIAKASKTILGITSYNQEDIVNYEAKKQLLSSFMGKENTASTALLLSQHLLKNHQTFAGTMLTLRVSRQNPGIDIYIMDVPNKTIQQLVPYNKQINAGTLPAYAAIVAQRGTDRSDLQTLILTDKATIDIKKIEENISNSRRKRFSILTINKTYLDARSKQREAEKDIRKKLLEELFTLMPAMKEQPIEMFEEVTVKQLKDYLKQLRKKNKEEDASAAEEEAEEEAEEK